MALSANPILHARTKHIELDLFFVREKVINGTVIINHVPAIDQIADIFTKPLSGSFFERLRNKLQVIPLGALELRGNVKRQVV